MHLPDILTPPVWIATDALAVGALGLCLKRLAGRIEDPHVPLMAVTGAFLFAAQMVNFPVAPGVSGHLVGSALGAILVGPCSTVIIFFAILVIQALLLADGGVLVLGANLLNMGVLGGFLGYGSYRAIVRLVRGNLGLVVGGAVAGWIAIVGSSAACAVELGLSEKMASIETLVALLTSVHAVIGIPEGVITACMIGFLRKVRPDLLDLPKR